MKLGLSIMLLKQSILISNEEPQILLQFIYLNCNLLFSTCRVTTNGKQKGENEK